MRRDIPALRDTRFDLVVIGGGMHGAWIALRAARAGLAVALLERDDFAAATSANSLKILHGGLRYLQHLDLPRMRRSIAARREHARLAPQLFEPLACVMPLERSGKRSPFFLGPALLINELVSWDRNQQVDPAVRLPAGRLLSGAACRAQLAPLAPSAAVAGALWWDGLARDTHRLGLEVLHAAASRGARIANHLEVDAYRLESGRVAGVEVTDRRSGEHFPIAARTVVNAAGPWAGDLSRAAGLSTAFMPPAWTGAMNVVLRRSLGNTAAVALSSPRHNREFFFVPWRGVTLIGTDYFPVDAAGGAAGTAPAQAVEQFVNEAAALAPAAGITPQDVALVHWGLLPLAARGDRLPARHPVLASGQAETGASGLVVLVAEKLTSAPMLSLQVMDRVRHELGGAGTSGGRQSVPSAPADPGMSPDGLDPVVTARLAARYGARWPAVASLAQADDSLLEPLVAASPVLKVELSHAIRGEMALTIPDLVRRLALGDAGEPDATVLGACEHFAATQWR